jgi:hypothetical protein
MSAATRRRRCSTSVGVSVSPAAARGPPCVRVGAQPAAVAPTKLRMLLKARENFPGTRWPGSSQNVCCRLSSGCPSLHQQAWTLAHGIGTLSKAVHVVPSTPGAGAGCGAAVRAGRDWSGAVPRRQHPRMRHVPPDIARGERGCAGQRRDERLTPCVPRAAVLIDARFDTVARAFRASLFVLGDLVL